MNESMKPSTENDPRVFEAVQRYLQQIESGRPPNRAELVILYPDLMETLEPYLDAIEMLQTAAPQLREPSASGSRKGEAIPEGFSAEPLGDFQLVREIGRGGMGVVYEAIQLSLGRKVAIKVLPFAAALDARQLQRFRNEAQAAAALHHPHIVPVYGVGCERGVHFYVMQLIEGQNLATLISEQRQEPGKFPQTIIDSLSHSHSLEQSPPARRETPREAHHETRRILGGEPTSRRGSTSSSYARTVAEIVAQAADALDYAHSLGVVHRDVKPANIIVDQSGVAWVADFGLAQVQSDHVLTQAGDLLGTLRYMSPEQASGQMTHVDQRSDVYSLGATLYELLTLQPLFAADHRQALLRQILDEKPPALKSAFRSLPRELETITRKALEKVPDERYASAGAMRDDLRRFLNDLPILARPPSLPERLTKWSRRHRGVVLSGVAALVLTVAGLSVATWMTASAYDRERAKAQEAAQQYERAEQNFRQARAAVDEFTRISESTLGDHPVLESARIRLLEAALTYYQNFVNQHRDNVSLHAELEATVSKVEHILNELNTLAGAGRYILLQDPLVRQELALTADQISQIETFDELWRDTFRETGHLSRTEREQRRIDLARRQDTAVQHLLTEPQRTRFQQIVWQTSGVNALDDSSLATALSLTANQRADIRQLLADYAAPRNGPPQRFRPPHDMGPGPPFHEMPPEPPPGPRPPRGDEDNWKRNDDLIRGELSRVLTADQQQQWKQILGKPFTKPLTRRPPPWGSFRNGPDEKDFR